MKAFVFASVMLVAGLAQAQSQTQCPSRLYKSATGWLCNLQKEDGSLVKACLTYGTHTVLNKEGIYMFELADESHVFMVNDDRHWNGCRVTTGFSACVHEEIRQTRTGISAVRRKAPDVWDARSSQQTIEFNYVNKSGEFRYSGKGPGGSAGKSGVLKFSGCTRI